MKVAVVSTDGINVNEHFGKAERFLIYELDANSTSLIEERKSTPLSVNDLQHSFNPERFKNVVNVIKDCKKVYITQIGDVPAEKLKAENIEPVIFDGPIKDIK